MTIALTGATGHLGTLVLQELLTTTSAGEVVAIARNAAKAEPLAELGVQVRVADYDDPQTLPAALDGVDRLLLISGSEVGRRVAQHAAVIDAAQAAGVGFVAYTSLLGIEDTINPLEPEHAATEAYLRGSGLPFALLRNGWYNENYTPVVQQAAATGAIVGSAGQGRTASAARADYAAAAAIVLAGPGHAGAVYELSGDTAWTGDDLAALVAQHSGRPVAYENVTPAEHERILIEAGVPEQGAGFAVAIDAAVARGDLGAVNGRLSGLIGRPATPIEQLVAEALA